MAKPSGPLPSASGRSEPSPYSSRRRTRPSAASAAAVGVDHRRPRRSSAVGSRPWSREGRRPLASSVRLVGTVTGVGGVGPTAALATRLRTGAAALDAGTSRCRRRSLGTSFDRLDSSRALAHAGSTMTVMWQVRLRMRPARPRARGRNRLSVGPSSAKQAETNSSSASAMSSLCGVAALATARGEHLADVLGDVALGELQGSRRRGGRLAADEVEHLAGLVGRRPHVAGPSAGCPAHLAIVAPSFNFGPASAATLRVLLLPGVELERPGGARTHRACDRPSTR